MSTTAVARSFPYRRTVQAIAYGVSMLMAGFFLFRLVADLKSGRDLASTVATQLLLLIPVSACIAVRKRFVITDESLARLYLFGRKEIRWEEVARVMRKEGSLQEVLRVTDRRGQTIEIPFEQLKDGKELYREVKARTAHAQWVSKVWFSMEDPPT
jgi:hypothetical protein